MKKKSWKRRIKILLGLVVIIPVLIIIFISPLTKYLVEKYDVKYTGREIKMDWAYVNPFTGYVYFSNLKIYESKSDSVFFSAASVSADFSVHKLFSKTYEITQLTLDKPRGIIIQNKTDLNLDDLIELFSPDEKKPSSGDPTHFSILSITIKDGELYYREEITPININITKLDLQSPGIRWDNDTIAAKFSFLSGLGAGAMDGDFAINTKNLDYRIASGIHHMDLDFINQYLKDLSNSGHFKASLDADLKTAGNFHDSQVLNATGKVVINEFHFGKDSLADFASFDRLVVDITQLNPQYHKYLFDSLLLTHPTFKYESYDHLDNIQTMFGEEGALIAAGESNPEKFNLVLEIGRYIRLLSKNFFSSDYQVKRLAISNGDVLYNDYSMNEKFSLGANPLFLSADSIDKNHKRVELTFQAAIKPFGIGSVFLSINPQDSSDFNLTYHFQKLPLAMFNPFLISYTSFPLDRGTLELNGQWNVINGFIASTNHLLVIDPRVSRRIRRKNSKWIPLPLVMAFVRERGNVIDYEIPITGDIRNPKFHLKDVFHDLLRNMFIKPPTTPYRMEVRKVENQVEKSVHIKWEMRQSELYPGQKKFVHKMAAFLLENPGASISIHPIEFAEKEKECILFFEAKKKYFLLLHHLTAQTFSENDSADVNKMNIRDSSFQQYLTSYCHDPGLYTIQQKCYRFIGEKIVHTRFKQLEQQRQQAFRSSFIENGTNSRVTFSGTTNTTPYNGYSSFDVRYNGEIPESLNRAYQKMDKLNEEAPRIRYFKRRKKAGGLFQQQKTTDTKRPLVRRSGNSAA